MARRATFFLLLTLLPFAGAVRAEDRVASEGGARRATAVVDDLLGQSQQTWDLAPLRELMRNDSKNAIRILVDRLDDDRAVAGLPSESQVYTVCGNALTLLERLTDTRICGEGRPWIGFATHDHRGARPNLETIAGPWRAWLAARHDLPASRWFWGLSHDELTRIQPLMRTREADWSSGDVARVVALGRRAWPYLLAKLRDDEYAVAGLRYCDQANALLRKLTGKDLGVIERIELLKLDPADPRRKHRLALATNRASMDLFAQRWTTELLAVPPR